MVEAGFQDSESYISRLKFGSLDWRKLAEENDYDFGDQPFQWNVKCTYSGYDAIKSGQLNSNGEIDGVGFVYVQANHLLEGQFTQDALDGYGQYTYPGGEHYIGEWRRGKKFGKGTYTYAGKNEGDVYTGDYKDDNKHGQGKYVHKSGKIEEGGWYNNRLHGKAKVIEADGTIVEGEFAYDKLK